MKTATSRKTWGFALRVSEGFLAIARKGSAGTVLKVGLYARVSTHDQQTLPMQLAAMREYAKRRGWKVALEEKEVGSGAKTRPKREELLRAARRREVDAIVVWRLASRPASPRRARKADLTAGLLPCGITRQRYRPYSRKVSANDRLPRD